MEKRESHFDPTSDTALPATFFERDPRLVAPELLGCVLASEAGGILAAGTIVETEAYLGSDDPGSHASTRGVTPRNAVMYGPPGCAYVYFTYGSHHMFNVVCEREGIAGAVLVRALEPLEGIGIMTERRGGRSLRELCSGPGKLAAALGVDLTDNGIALGAGRLQAYAGSRHGKAEVAASGRVGLSRGHELPFRFYVESSTFVSRGRTGAPSPRTGVEERGRT
jgi:DNA-3-methyladenine glycosylase